MTDEAGQQAFRRSPALAVMSMFWAILLGIVGGSNLSAGLVAAFCLAGAVVLFVNAWWCWKTPYVRVNGGGLTAYPSIVSRPRAVAWAAVARVETRSDGRLYLVGHDDAGMSLRMKTVIENQRNTLVEEVQRLSGRRLRIAPTKAARLH
jgi:hypothetical protein